MKGFRGKKWIKRKAKKENCHHNNVKVAFGKNIKILIFTFMNVQTLVIILINVDQFDY